MERRQENLGTAMAGTEAATAVAERVLGRIGELRAVRSTTDIGQLAVAQQDDLSDLRRHLHDVAGFAQIAVSALPVRRPNRLKLLQDKIDSAWSAVHVAVGKFEFVESMYAIHERRLRRACRERQRHHGVPSRRHSAPVARTCVAMTSLDDLAEQFSEISRLLSTVGQSLTAIAQHVDEENESTAQHPTRRQDLKATSVHLQADVHTVDRAIAAAVATFETIEDAVADLADDARVDAIVDRLREAHVNLIVLRVDIRVNANRLADLGRKLGHSQFASQVTLHTRAMATMDQALRQFEALEAQNPHLLGESSYEAFSTTGPIGLGADSHRAIKTVNDLIDAGQNTLTALHLTTTCLVAAKDTGQAASDSAHGAGFRKVREQWDVVQERLGAAIAETEEATAMAEQLLHRIGELPAADSVIDVRHLLADQQDDLGSLVLTVQAVDDAILAALRCLPAQVPNRLRLPLHKIESASNALAVALRECRAIGSVHDLHGVTP